MSRKFELTITPDYVPDWTVADAIRELFQNALDQEAIDPTNKMSWDWGDDTLAIDSERGELTADTLLLGQTTKADSPTTIGQFGEGYKIATLVLLRNGKEVTFYNYARREVWRPRFVDSRRYGCKILTFFVEKFIWSTPPHSNLTIEVKGITRNEMRDDIIPTNLWMQNDIYQDGSGLGNSQLQRKIALNLPYRMYNVDVQLHNEYGRCLSTTRHKGQIFVNGLYICTHDDFMFGYDFKPKHLTLDRDRKLASDFNLRYASTQFWRDEPELMDYVEKGYADVTYAAHVSYNKTHEAFERFRNTHGIKSVPVTTQEEADAVPAGYKAIIVPEVFKNMIRSSWHYEEPKQVTPPPLVRLKEWFDMYHIHFVPDDMVGREDEVGIVIEFNDIYRELEELVNG